MCIFMQFTTEACNADDVFMFARNQKIAAPVAVL